MFATTEKLPKEILDLIMDDQFQAYIQYVLKEIIEANGDEDEILMTIIALSITSMKAIQGDIKHD